MKHVLPALPYAFDALEPHVDGRTMQLHHQFHHATYVSNLNAALKRSPELQDRCATGRAIQPGRSTDGMHPVLADFRS
jgi:superoxide dismutase